MTVTDTEKKFEGFRYQNRIRLISTKIQIDNIIEDISARVFHK